MKPNLVPKHSGSGRSRALASVTKLRAKRRSSSSLFTVNPPTSEQLTPASSAAFAASVGDSSVVVPPPTRDQLIRVFQRAAIPMVGFGFVDQTIMLQAGHAIDCTIGVTFGLSTLTSAAFGQVCSDASGAMFGSTLERLADRAGLPPPNLTAGQKALTVVQRAKFMGTLLGVITGCVLGLLNLLVIDTERSSTLKLQAFASDSYEFDFAIEASNAYAHEGATAPGGNRSGIPTTVLTVRGPDVDGVLASMTAALSAHGCSLVELHAGRGKAIAKDASTSGDGGSSSDDGSTSEVIEDVFHVVKRETSQPYDDDELEDLAKTLLEATRTPMNVHAVKSKMIELERLNANLHERVQKLEQVVIDRQITVVPSYAAGSS
jgi:Transmembrane protein 65